MNNNRLIIILSVVLLLLMIPLIAMQFTDEVNWDIVDFVTMGVLLTGTGLLCEFAMRKVNSSLLRVVVCLCILFIFFLIWAELAVGIFGSPFAGS
jgi:hypothetical protein